MFSTKSFTAAAAAFALISSSTAKFDLNSKANTVVYWGAGGNQLRLSEYCYSDNIDIINIAFIDAFPAQADGLISNEGYASNACWGSPKYAGPGYNGPADPTQDKLYTLCPPLQQDLYDCQQNTTKKYFISLGGQSTSVYQLDSAADGEYLANLLWGMFGPIDAPIAAKWQAVRPFDRGDTNTNTLMNIDIDGFDFDIEKPSPNQQAGYIKCIETLRALYDAYYAYKPSSKKYYITGAPQCPLPEANMGTMINEAKFDLLWPQFYNNKAAGCTARQFADTVGSDAASAKTNFNFAAWEAAIAGGASSDAKLFIGLLGGKSGSSGSPDDYITPAEAKKLISTFKGEDSFGGVMIWDAVSSNDASPGIAAGKAYYDEIKAILAPATSSSSSSSSSTPTPTPTPSSSSTTSSAAASTTSSSAAASSTSPAPYPTHVPKVGNCKRIGCYSEATTMRALTPFTYTDYALQSPEICAAQCPGYAYFGVEYGGECYCGNTINEGSILIDDALCFMPCDGNTGELCGGPNALDLYSCYASSSSTSSAAASSTSSESYPSSSSAAASSTSSESYSSSSSAAASSTSSESYPSSSSAAASSTSSESYSSSSSAAASSTSSESYPSSSSSSAATSSSESYPTSSSSTYSESSSSSESYSSSSSSASYLESSSSSESYSYPTSSSYVSSSSYSYPTSTSSSGPSSTSTGGGVITSTSSSSTQYTTSTVYTEITRTITSCAATVTDCPAKGTVVTETSILYTTVCPVTETEKSVPTYTPIPTQYTTSTVYATTTYTITSCAATVTDCPAKLGQVTTEVIKLYTTVCPVSTDTLTTTISSTTTNYVTVKLIKSTATVVPVSTVPYPTFSTELKALGTGLPSVSLTYSTVTGSPTAVQFKGAASSSRGPMGVMIAVVLGAVALMM